ncbi:MAG TPA: diacylglycerol kinase [Xanthobacteraceae bacterium]|nr:diacylglycerol kinase [Xanthobacteraceae bacterium]
MKRLYSAAANTMRGLTLAAKSEAAFREEIVLLLAALPLGVFLAPGIGWYVAMIGALFLVMAVELLNTAIEKLADHITPEWNAQIGMIKDMGSAAVFCALCVAGLVWLAALAVRIGWF